jgi:hypothetical protein
VVGIFHRDSHLLEHGDRTSPEVRSQTLRRVVEITRLVHRRRRLARLDRILEEKELHLRVGVKRKSKIGGLLQRPLQHIAGIGVRGRAVRHRDVAEHPRGGGTDVAPRQNLEGRWVRMCQHV